MKTFSLNRIEDTITLARRLAKHARPGDIYTLQGDLGVGKTAFARAFIHSLTDDASVDVTSPTFTLLQTYPVKLSDGVHSEIWHFDLYRINHESELLELGIDEALAHIMLIEWPERLGNYILPVAVALEFRLNEDGTREVILSGEKLP